MNFEYLKTDGEFILKNSVNIDNEKLSKIYEELFNKYAVRKSFEYESEKNTFFIDDSNVVIKNLEIIPLNKKIYSAVSGKMQDGYNISYDAYEKPELCKIIEELTNPDTFDYNYVFLNTKLTSLRKEKIEKLRFEIDREIRKIEVMLDDPSFDCYLSLQKIRCNEKKIIKLCEFDREYASFVSKILDTIEVKEIDRLLKNDFERMVCFLNCKTNQDVVSIPNKVLKKISSC